MRLTRRENGNHLGVDTVARPGAMVSGSVTFSDGQKGHWYLDQMGRLGVAPEITVFEVTADPNVPIDPAAIGTDVPTIIDAGITYRVRASKSADKA